MKRVSAVLALSLLLASAGAFAQAAPEASTEADADAEMTTETTTETSAEATQEMAAEAATDEEATAKIASESTPVAAISIALPPEGKGQVVFFREKKFAGGGVRYKVREGSAELGKLSSGSYFVHVAEPGAHEYTVHSEAKDILNLEIESGETYYVLGSVTMGVLAGRPNLAPSDQATFDGMAGKLKPAK